MNARAESTTTHRIVFSDRLRMLLVQKGHDLVPHQLAASITQRTTKPVGPQAVGNWLNSVQIPNHGNLIALAAFLSVTPEYLLEGTPVLQFAPAKHADIDTDQLVADFQKLDAYGRRVAKALISSLARLKGGAA
jgi:transcriptional regulator with XRE-family HTH domain